MESQILALVDPYGGSRDAVLRRWDESPGNDDEVMLELSFGETVIRATSERGYFHAFCEVRHRLEPFDLMPLCLAACENVYPSPMIESMGIGEQAYVLTLGKPATTCDLVSIFDSPNGILPSTVARQKRFYDQWIESL